jgi:glycosyltransferase involved in cell wall biosynthesis
VTFPNSLKQVKSEVPKDGCAAIIMRTKNRSILLSRAFGSVFSQTYENWHLYIVNDGGKRDEVEKLMAANEKAFRGRVTVIHHETSLGMEAASNSALKQSKGEFLIVHDDDDTWQPEFLEKTVGFLNDPKNISYAAVTTNICRVHEKIVGEAIVELERYVHPLFRVDTHYLLDFSRILSKNEGWPISWLMRRSVVNVVGEFNHELPVQGDWDYNIRMLMIGDIGTIPEPLANYHLRYTESDKDYSNSAIAREKLHEKYRVLYWNSLVRSAINANPDMLGLVRAVTYPIIESQEGIQAIVNLQLESLNRRFERLEAAVVDTHLLLNKFLGPARWAFSLTRPFRKLIAKFSKRN